MANSAVNRDRMRDKLDLNPCGRVEHEAVMLRKRASCDAFDSLSTVLAYPTCHLKTPEVHSLQLIARACCVKAIPHRTERAFPIR
ncbi:hypothetical protein KC361_g69 [Hortaea werneckii]|nr:hypothetical protein KC361_g69 [Hortaea werneckii]